MVRKSVVTNKQTQNATIPWTCAYGVGPLLPLTGVPLVGPDPPQGQESIEVLLLFGDSTRSLGLVNVGESQLGSGGVGLELLSLNG